MASGNRAPFENPVIEWIDSRLPVFTLMNREYGVFPTPRNFTYLWSFGGIAMVMLITMILTGVFLAMHYTPHATLAFGSVEHIMRDVNWGWMIRYLHMNGASFFFIAVYIHIFRAMYYGSYKRPREVLWILGVVIFLLMMATAFMGYTLPWSQMGGWGATVITNLFSAIPVVGNAVVSLLWGGFSVDNPTLNRFFALHYLLPFVIVGVVFLHVWALHITGSNNPLGIEPKGPQDTLPFHPFYTVKDAFGLSVFLLVYLLVAFFVPDLFSHPDGYVEFDPMKTPSHIIPEWYFLPFYAILRAITFGINPYILIGLIFAVISIIPVYDPAQRFRHSLKVRLGLASPAIVPPMGNAQPRLVAAALAGIFVMLGYLSQYQLASGGSAITLPFSTLVLIDGKLGGVLAMFGAVAILFVMPWLDSHPVRSSRFRPLYRLFLMVLVAAFVLLGWIGMEPADAVLFQVGSVTIPLLWLGQICTIYYFAFFLAILPWLSRHERAKPLPNSINEAVFGPDHHRTVSTEAAS